MTNLTEKWKKGELPAGWYYIKFDTTDNLYITFYEKSEHYFNYCGVHIPEKEITSILAPVPSFEQWQAKLEENTKLKELLKECKQWFDWYHIDTGTGKEYIERWHKKGHEIHQRINQVLGEE